MQIDLLPRRLLWSGTTERAKSYVTDADGFWCRGAGHLLPELAVLRREPRGNVEYP